MFKKVIVITLLIFFLVKTQLVVGSVYSNYFEVFYDKSYPIHVEIKEGVCDHALTVEQLLSWFDSGNTNTWKYVNAWTDKFLLSDNNDFYSISRFIFAEKTNYECVVGRLRARIYVPERVTVALGLDSDDASAILIDGQPVLTWLDGHSPCGCVKYSTTVTLEKGYHLIEGYVQDKTGHFVLALYINRNSVWKIVDSNDFIFVPISGSVNENKNELIIHYAEDPSPVVGEWASTISLTDGTTNLFLHNYAIVRANWGSKGTATMSELRLTEGVEVPSKDYYVGHAYTVVYVPQSGWYELGLSGDDGVDLRIDGKIVLSYYGLHGTSQTTPQVSGSVYLTKGFHLFEVYYYERKGGSDGRVFVKVNGAWQILGTNNTPFRLYKPLDWYFFVKEFAWKPNVKVIFVPQGESSNNMDYINPFKLVFGLVENKE